MTENNNEDNNQNIDISQGSNQGESDYRDNKGNDDTDSYIEADGKTGYYENSEEQGGNKNSSDTREDGSVDYQTDVDQQII